MYMYIRVRKRNEERERKDHTENTSVDCTEFGRRRRRRSNDIFLVYNSYPLYTPTAPASAYISHLVPT